MEGEVEWVQDNPCYRVFVECEGDCQDCPNKLFFAQQDASYLLDGQEGWDEVPQ